MKCVKQTSYIVQRKQEYMRSDNLIIDGTNIEFRFFFVFGTSYMSNFLDSFRNIVEEYNPTNVYASWDKKLVRHSSNFRKDIMEGQYKAGRKKHPDIQEMYDREIILIEMLESLGVKNIFPNVLEADDVCAWLSMVLPGKNIIVSADHDLLQMVTPDTSVFNLKKLTTFKNFESVKGMSPKEFILFKAIKGDDSDNIPGVPGYGDVKSTRLAKNWNAAVLTEENLQIVERNIRLMNLRYGFNHQEGERQKYEEQLNYVKNVKGDIVKFVELCSKYNFTSCLEDVSGWKRLLNRNNIVSFISELQDK